MGNIERNQLGLPISMQEDSKGNYVDSKGKVINSRGYLLDKRGHIIDKSGKLMFRKAQLTQDGDLPVPASIDRFNFIPFKITGNFQAKPKSDSDTLDNNKRMVNKQGFLIDNKGHIVTQKGKIMLDKCFLREDGSFPEMLNYQG